MWRSYLLPSVAPVTEHQSWRWLVWFPTHLQVRWGPCLALSSDNQAGVGLLMDKTSKIEWGSHKNYRAGWNVHLVIFVQFKGVFRLPRGMPGWNQILFCNLWRKVPFWPNLLPESKLFLTEWHQDPCWIQTLANRPDNRMDRQWSKTVGNRVEDMLGNLQSV